MPIWKDIPQEQVSREVEIVKRALKTKLWRPDPEQAQRWQVLLAEMKSLHQEANVSGIEVDSGDGVLSMRYMDIVPATEGEGKVIRMRKYSLTSFLHAFYIIKKEAGLPGIRELTDEQAAQLEDAI